MASVQEKRGGDNMRKNRCVQGNEIRERLRVVLKHFDKVDAKKKEFDFNSTYEALDIIDSMLGRYVMKTCKRRRG